MKNLFIFSLIASIFALPASAISWWEQMTVCRIDNTKCYSSTGVGYDSEMWDTGSNCRGMKYICSEALVEKSNEPKLISKKDLENRNIIKTDFDTNLLSAADNCFGVRKTTKTGSQVMVNGKYVNVWCNGVLDKSDEGLENGEIVYGTQPTCESLKKDGYIATENGKCFGKYYDTSKYHIECEGNLAPERIIVLNGAEYSNIMHMGPKTETEAEKIFNKMQSVSKSQKAQYFKK